ncbi:hypothetical protein KR215_001361 [Drosophila sulfurigaster]|nr:hypothetical protein KR215_001361 [Drosophila sulfurigaster]
MAEEKHRMLYQGQDPSQPVLRHLALLPRACSDGNIPVAPQQLPTYDDAVAKASHLPAVDRRRTFFAEPQHLRSRLELEQQSVNASATQLPYEVVSEVQPAAAVRLPQVRSKLTQLQYLYRFFALAPQPKLAATSCAIVCPACGQQGRTRLQRMPNARTHTWALWLCSFGWCCCCCLYPYVLRGCRTTSHYCNACRTFLGAYYPRDCCP